MQAKVSPGAALRTGTQCQQRERRSASRRGIAAPKRCRLQQPNPRAPHHPVTLALPLPSRPLWLAPGSPAGAATRVLWPGPRPARLLDGPVLPLPRQPHSSLVVEVSGSRLPGTGIQLPVAPTARQRPTGRSQGRTCACGALSERQRGGGEGQKGVASVGAMLYQKRVELTGSASRRVASEPTNR